MAVIRGGPGGARPGWGGVPTGEGPTTIVGVGLGVGLADADGDGVVGAAVGLTDEDGDGLALAAKLAASDNEGCWRERPTW